MVWKGKKTSVKKIQKMESLKVQGGYQNPAGFAGEIAVS